MSRRTVAYCKHGCGRGVDAAVYPDELVSDGSYDCKLCGSERVFGMTLVLDDRIPQNEVRIVGQFNEVRLRFDE